MKNLIVLLIPILLAGCLENSPGFLEPQPTDSKNLKAFPKKMRGDYSMNEKENLSISQFMIIQWGMEDIDLSMAEIDSNSQLIIKNDTLYDIEDGEKIFVEIRNDSLFGSMYWSDTAFTISDINIIRKCDDFYLLNEYTKDSVWKVVRMKFDKTPKIEFATINKKNEAEELKKFTTLLNIEMKYDTIVDYRLKPTKEEFKQMLSSDNLFTDKEEYQKVSSK